jgi:hypothetical protein
MGREIRRVPADWDHPKDSMPWGWDHKPLHDEPYSQAFAEWQKGLKAWLAGKYQNYPEGYLPTAEGYAEWAGRSPDPDMYRPDWPEKVRTHYQYYETVSEGTPLSPPLPTLEALADWLVANGDPVYGAIDRKTAEAFVKVGGSPSAVIIPGRGLVDGVHALGMDDA